MEGVEEENLLRKENTGGDEPLKKEELVKKEELAKKLNVEDIKVLSYPPYFLNSSQQYNLHLIHYMIQIHS